MNNLANLPTEIMMLIIGHIAQRDISSLAQVSTFFYAIVSPLLYRTICIQHPVPGLGFLYCLVLARHPVGQWIRHIELRDFYLTDNALMALMRRTPFLEKLVLDSARRITHQSIQHASHYWPQLTTLHLEENFTMMDNDIIPWIQGLAPGRLTHLTLTDGAAFSDHLLDVIGTFHPQLIELNVSFNYQFTPDGVRHLVHRCRQLTLVTLSYCRLQMHDFVEAGPQCAGPMVTLNNTYIALHHLDQDALERIRDGTDPRQ